MNKLPAVYFQGSAYLRVSSLSFNQTAFIKDWISQSDIISFEECPGSVGTYVQYDQYDFWFENIKSEEHVCEALEF